MTINANIITLASCGCRLEYTWDSEVSQEDRIHTFLKTHNACNDHSQLYGQEHFDIALKENGIHTEIRQKIIDFIPDLTADVEVAFNWSGEFPHRTIQVTTAGATLTEAQRTVAQNHVDKQFGIGKVVIV